MRIEAHYLRIADVVRLPWGDAEVVRRQDFRDEVRVWFQGHEHRVVFDTWEILEIQRPATTEHGPLAAERVQPGRPPGRPPQRPQQADRVRKIARLLGNGLVALGNQSHSDEVIVGALMLAADEVERGRLSYLARLTVALQIDDLETALSHARHERRRQTKARIEKHGPDLTDIEFARYEFITDPRAFNRLARLGIRDSPTLRAALREYLGCCGKVKRERPTPLPAKLPPLEVLVPVGWTVRDTIVVAALLKGKPSWLAWQPATRLQRQKAEGHPWTAPESPPRGFDIDAEVTRVLRQALADAPHGMIFRGAGPWLGHLYPSDFGERMSFDPPTGGKVYIEALRADHRRWLVEVEKRPSKLNKTRLKRASERLSWAAEWIAKHGETADPGDDDEFDEFNDWDDFAAWMRRRELLEQLRDHLQHAQVRVSGILNGLRGEVEIGSGERQTRAADRGQWLDAWDSRR